MKQVVLLRVGVVSACGGIQGPLFGDGSFEFVCIPDNHGVSAYTYGNILGRDGKPLSGYFAESRVGWRCHERVTQGEQPLHVRGQGSHRQLGDGNPATHPIILV